MFSLKLILPQVEKKGVGEEEGWRLCLAKAGEVLASCVEILADVEDQEILQEIATAKEAHSRLQGTAITVSCKVIFLSYIIS